MTSFFELYKKIRSSYNPHKKSMERQNYFVSGMRQLSFVATIPFAWLGISPNTVTIIGFMISILAAFMLTQEGIWLQSAGVLILAAYLFDFIDGNLARTYQKTTHYGKFLDSITGVICYPIWILGLGISIGLNESSVPPVAGWRTMFGNGLIIGMTGASILFIFLESFLHVRFSHIFLELKAFHANTTSASTIPVSSTRPARGWRSIPGRYELFFYQIWFPMWFLLCVFKKPFLLLVLNFVACFILAFLNFSRYFLKARAELNVYRTP